jgi:hypothetical protein
MKTLTVTAARKNLSRWLGAAARGQDIGTLTGPPEERKSRVPVGAVRACLTVIDRNPEAVEKALMNKS